MFDPEQPLSQGRIVVFDTEATGLSPERDRVVEIAAIAFEDGREAGTFESLINPGIPIPGIYPRREYLSSFSVSAWLRRGDRGRYILIHSKDFTC